MFTGIIEELGQFKKIIKGATSAKLYIKCNKILSDIKIGDSIAVNGICLTASGFGSDWFCADIMPETARKTGLDKLGLTDALNLERALKACDRLGGHIVTGHIDGIGIISNIKKEENAIWLTIKAPQSILKYIVNKGSVSLDGISLTVAYVDDKCFKVSIIPITAGHTTIGYKKIGSTFNIECDIMGKYIDKAVNNKKLNGISLEFLAENGFI